MKYPLSKLVKIMYGKNQKDVLDENGKYPIYGTGGLMAYSNKYLYDKPSVLIGRKGTINKVKYVDIPFWTVDTLFYTIINEEYVLPKFLYYKMLTIDLDNYNEGTTIPSLRTETLYKIELDIPSISIQGKSIKILEKIDEKIMLNNKINNNLYNIGVNIYNEIITKNSEFKELKSFFNVITGKKDANASDDKGIYPFFTCSKQISRINEYSFDAPAILLAGNGDFNVKVYKGKFDAYQRTYVLIPNNALYLGYLYFAISENLSDLTSSFRGSVIKFITKGMIENYKIPYIYNENIYKYLNNIVEKIRSNTDENEKLLQLRDTLLPKLMNGEIDLDNIEI